MVVQLTLNKHVNDNLVIYFIKYALLCNVKFWLSRFWKWSRNLAGFDRGVKLRASNSGLSSPQITRGFFFTNVMNNVHRMSCNPVVNL